MSRKANRKRKLLAEGHKNEDDPLRAEKAAIRSKTLPFMDSMMKVSETLKLHETFRDKPALSSTQSATDDASHSMDVASMSVEPAQSIGPPLVSAGVLRRRYPRFCEGLAITEELVADIAPRSDVWLNGMVEGCYDDAIEASFKEVGGLRNHKRCGLQLGALDAFSLVASRYIARIYSVMEVRNRISVELLITMEASKAKGNPMNSLTKNDSLVYDTDRIIIFSKFLAGEWDLDFLALFLNCRDILQNHFDVKFRELTMQSVRSPEDPFDYPEKLRDILLTQRQVNDRFSAKSLVGPLAADTPALPPLPATKRSRAEANRNRSHRGDDAPLRRTESQGSYFVTADEEIDGDVRGQSKRKKRTTLKPLYRSETNMKIVPVALPPTLYFVPDGGLLEAPSLAFHVSSLPVCCEVVLPKCHSKLRKYLASRVIHGLRKRIEAVAPPGHHEINIDTSDILIPVSVFLFVICEEWRLMPSELRVKLSSVGQATPCLEKLNDVYASNCVAQKERLEEIRHTEVLLSQCKAALITLEKKIRRGERRWKENRKHATNEELEQLQNLKLTVTEETARRLSLESAIKGMHRRHHKEQLRVDKLWEEALKGGNFDANVKLDISLRTRRPVATVLEDKPVEITATPANTWREDISDFFIRAVKYNLDQEILIQKDKEKKEELLSRSKEQVTIVGQGTTSDADSPSTAEQAISKELRSDLSLEDYISMVRKQAEELAFTGSDIISLEKSQNTDVNIPPPPMFQESAEHIKLQGAIQKTVLERMEAKRLVFGVLDVAEGNVVDTLDIRAKHKLVSSDSFSTRDVDYQLELMARSAVSVAERRILMSELSTMMSIETALEIDRRCDDLAAQLIDAVSEEYIAATVPTAIRTRVDELAKCTHTAVESDICEQMCTSLFYTAVNSYVDILCTASSFAVLETTTEELINTTALIIGNEEGKRKENEKIKVLKSVLNGIIVKIEKEMEVYDPKWSPLEEDPKRFLPYKTLCEVEKFRATLIEKQRMGSFKVGIEGFRRAGAIRKVKRIGRKVWCIRIFAKWLGAYQQQRLMLRSVVRMQAVARVLCKKRQVATLRVYENKLNKLIESHTRARDRTRLKSALEQLRWAVQRKAHLSNLYRGIHSYILFRNYKYWKDKYLRITVHSRLDLSARKIQCIIRIFLAKRNVYYRGFARVLVAAARVYLNRKVLHARKVYCLRSSDIQTLKRSRYERHMQIMRFNAWWQLSSLSRGLQKAVKTWQQHKLQIGFGKLWREVLSFRNKQQRAATLMNACVRKFIDQRQVLHYSKFNRGLRRIQAIARGRTARKQFDVLVYLHEMATKIEKIFRGWKTREDILNARIRDLHYGAMTNNYEKILHYLDRFPELMVSLDADGNNLLHSAAAGAAKRSLKLILKYDRLELNALNYNGFSPLHMLIMSTAVDRDNLFDYMTGLDFDEFQNTADGKTSLLLATESKHLFIGQALIEDGVDGSLADNKGTNCLQAACVCGLPKTYLNRLINYANCDAHCPGQHGRFPIHDAADEGTLENVDFLVWRGVDVNARGIQNGETALMLACQNGHVEVAKFLLLQGCDAKMSDYHSRNAAHYGAYSDSAAIIDLVREADVDIDQVDQSGDTPLHIAASIGSSTVVKNLLELGAAPSVQNYEGNQPTHIAARGNHVECLKELMTYEQYIGRMNYAHQTPLGIAKFHSSREAQAFLEHNFIFFVDEAERNKHGDIWWDKPIDEAVSQWELSISPHGKRTFHNIETGEVSDLPPSMETDWISHYSQDAKLPLTQKVHLKPEVHDFSAHQYLLDQEEEKKRVSEARAVYRTATIISKWARRKLVYNEVRRTKHHQQLIYKFSRWIWRTQYRLKKWRKARKTRCATLIQKTWRGFSLRNWMYYSGEHYRLWFDRAGRYLKTLLWRSWKNHLVWRLGMKLQIVATAPKRIDEWQAVLDEAGMALRTFGLFEEYAYPGSKNLVKFYRNTFNGQFSFHQPSAWAKRDKQDLIDARFLRVNGYIPSHMRAAVMFQALWRGFTARKQFVLVLKAARIATDAEMNYLNNPDDDRNLFNYALYCHAFKLDFDRARVTYQEAMRRMEHAGPDIAPILYAYGIFCLVSYYQDERDCMDFINRGKKAEELAEVSMRARMGIERSVAIENGTYSHGKIFSTADVGFFKRAATHMRDSENWHNYAVSRWLVYDDFVGSFDAFMNAFTTNPTEIRLRANFELMMTHFHGHDKAYKTRVIQERNMAIAQKECDLENERLEFGEIRFQKNKAALRIQRFIRHHTNRKRNGNRAKMSGKAIAHML